MPAGARVLLVEDDRAIRESMVEALSDEGYEATSAVDGLDALDQLNRADLLPQVIVLDLMMPRMSGPELAAELEKSKRLSPIPIVVVSADSRVQAKAESMKVAAWLKKPVKLDELFQALTRVMRDAPAGHADV